MRGASRWAGVLAALAAVAAAPVARAQTARIQPGPQVSPERVVAAGTVLYAVPVDLDADGREDRALLVALYRPEEHCSTRSPAGYLLALARNTPEGWTGAALDVGETRDHFTHLVPLTFRGVPLLAVLGWGPGHEDDGEHTLELYRFDTSRFGAADALPASFAEPAVEPAGAATRLVREVFPGGGMGVDGPEEPPGRLTRGDTPERLVFDSQASGRVVLGGTPDRLVRLRARAATVGEPFGSVALPLGHLPVADQHPPMWRYCGAGGCPHAGWRRAIGSDEYQPVLLAPRVDGSGNVYVAGMFMSEEASVRIAGAVPVSSGPARRFLASFGPDGALRWIQTERGWGRAVLIDFDVDATGRTYTLQVDSAQEPSSGLLGDMLVIACRDPDGTPRWSTPVLRHDDSGIPPFINSWRIAAGPRGDVYLLGPASRDSKFQTLQPAGTGTVLLAYNADGTERWLEDLWGHDLVAGQPMEYASAEHLAVDPVSGDVVVSGTFTGRLVDPRYELESEGGLDGFALRFSRDRAFRWARRFGGQCRDEGGPVAFDRRGRLYLAGRIEDKANLDGRVLRVHGRGGVLSRLDANGRVAWARGLEGQAPNELRVDATGRAVLSGTFEGPRDPDTDEAEPEIEQTALLARFDARGEDDWWRREDDSHNATLVAVDPRGRLLGLRRSDNAWTLGVLDDRATTTPARLAPRYASRGCSARRARCGVAVFDREPAWPAVFLAFALSRKRRPRCALPRRTTPQT